MKKKRSSGRKRTYKNKNQNTRVSKKRKGKLTTGDSQKRGLTPFGGLENRAVAGAVGGSEDGLVGQLDGVWQKQSRRELLREPSHQRERCLDQGPPH